MSLSTPLGQLYSVTFGKPSPCQLSMGLVCSGRYIFQVFLGLSQQNQIVYFPHYHPSHLLCNSFIYQVSRSIFPEVTFSGWSVSHTLISALSNFLNFLLHFLVIQLSQRKEIWKITHKGSRQNGSKVEGMLSGKTSLISPQITNHGLLSTPRIRSELRAIRIIIDISVDLNFFHESYFRY